MAMAGTPSTRASVRRSSTPSCTSATCESRTGRPARWATTMALNPETSRGLPEMRTGTSCPPRSSRPSGVLTFSPARPAMTSSTPRPSESIREGSSSTLTSRLTSPTRSILPTPGRFSSRRFTRRSTRVESSRGVSSWDRTASETMAMPPMSNFWMTGSSIPCGSSLRMAAILERASWETSLTFDSRVNSTVRMESPSREVE